MYSVRDQAFFPKEVFQPAKGFRFDIQVGGDIFLRHALQHLGVAADIVQEAFAGTLLQLIEIAVVFFYEQVRDHDPSQAFDLGGQVVQLLQAFIGNGKKRPSARSFPRPILRGCGDGMKVPNG